MKLYSTFFLASMLCLSSFLFAPQMVEGQALGCDGNRYINDITPTVKKTTVKYASMYNQANVLVDLYMDIYEPETDALAMRPAIVLAHGGSFVFGTKEDMKSFCEVYARKGFVAVSISYRLFPALLLGFPTGENVMETSILARSDMKAAIRHLRMDAATTNTFKVDPDYVFIGGLSAGAINALDVAMIDEDEALPANIQGYVNANGGFHGNSGSAANQTYSDEVLGVVSLSGGLFDADWLDADDVTLMSMHGTADDVVNYNQGLAAGLVELEGSGNLHARANLIGMPNYLKTVPGGGHTNIYTDAQYQPQLLDFMNTSLGMIQNIMCTSSAQQYDYEATWSIQPNPSQGSFALQLPENITQAEYVVRDMHGRLVASGLANNGEKINMNASLQAGMYFVEIVVKDNKQVMKSTKKLVITE